MDLVFSFPGPDRRYKYTHVHFTRDGVLKLIQDYKVAFERYEKLKVLVPAGTDLSEQFNKSLTIRAGRIAPGVCMAGYRNPISDSQSLAKTVFALRRIIERGDELVKAIETL